MSIRTINIGPKSYKGEIVGFDSRTGDLHMRLSNGQDLVKRNGKIKIVDRSKVGPYLAKDGFTLFSE